MLPVVPEGYIRLYRVDGRIQPFVETLDEQTRAELDTKIRGRWFSDDISYIRTGYAKPWTTWTYVDVPKEVAEASRYENVRDAEGIYGVEGRDFFLPREWADKRQPCDEPEVEKTPHKTIKFTEITSNAAVPGKVLDYDPETGRAVIVRAVDGGFALIITKCRRTGEYKEEILPIRQVKSIWDDKPLTK